MRLLACIGQGGEWAGLVSGPHPPAASTPTLARHTTCTRMTTRTCHALKRPQDPRGKATAREHVPFRPPCSLVLDADVWELAGHQLDVKRLGHLRKRGRLCTRRGWVKGGGGSDCARPKPSQAKPGQVKWTKRWLAGAPPVLRRRALSLPPSTVLCLSRGPTTAAPRRTCRCQRGTAG